MPRAALTAHPVPHGTTPQGTQAPDLHSARSQAVCPEDPDHRFLLARQRCQAQSHIPIRHEGRGLRASPVGSLQAAGTQGFPGGLVSIVGAIQRMSPLETAMGDRGIRGTGGRTGPEKYLAHCASCLAHHACPDLSWALPTCHEVAAPPGSGGQVQAQSLWGAGPAEEVPTSLLSAPLSSGPFQPAVRLPWARQAWGVSPV